MGGLGRHCRGSGCGPAGVRTGLWLAFVCPWRVCVCVGVWVCGCVHMHTYT